MTFNTNTASGNNRKDLLLVIAHSVMFDFTLNYHLGRHCCSTEVCLLFSERILKLTCSIAARYVIREVEDSNSFEVYIGIARIDMTLPRVGQNTHT